MVFLLVIAVSIVVALATYALYLHRQLRSREQERAEAEQQLAQQQEKVREDAKQSVVILARALLAGELTLTEGCIRIAWLLARIDPNARHVEAFTVFYQVADATAHIPILDAWKALSRGEQQAYERERLEIENKFRDFVHRASEQLVMPAIFEGIKK